jgi:raffinose/stachyose/melibiose transport system permease protein
MALAIMSGAICPGALLFVLFFFLPYVFFRSYGSIMFLNLFNSDPDRGLINALFNPHPGMKLRPGWETPAW